MKKDIKELLDMEYLDIADYLKEKYGNVPKNYFMPSGNKTPGITRGSEGLYIHHIDEDKMIMLSTKISEHPVINKGILTKEQIKLIEYDFQKKENLVYCDLLEHLLLHLKIMEYQIPLIEGIQVGVGGVINFIVPELNDIFSGIEYKVNWKKTVISNIIERKEEYFLLLKFGIEKLGIDRTKYLSSFNSRFGIWDPKNNIELFQEFDKYF